LSFADALNPYTTLETKPTLVGIQLDGVIEEEWSGAARFDNFAEFMPTHQIAARVRTEGYVTHDDTDLFLAFVCYDPDIDRLRASLTDRDQIYRDDFVGIIIDTYRDQQRAYEFFSNAHGIQGDMLWNASRSERDDESFDAVWESEGRIYEDRWVVEMKIPLSCLRYPNRAQQNWGVHFVRVYPRENRYQFSWMPISQDNNSFMAQAGGLALHLGQSAMASRSLEVIPFISGSRTDELADDGTGNGVWRNQDGGSINASQRLGFTAKYRLATNHVVDFALRPDFSQIESDGGRINVNQPWAFFFPERRPFFMEGNDVFLVDYSSSGMILDVANPRPVGPVERANQVCPFNPLRARAHGSEVAGCALPHVGFRCMRPLAWKRRMAPTWKGYAGMSCDRPWPPVGCRWWTPSRRSEATILAPG
jgi:hypothetical protein